MVVSTWWRNRRGEGKKEGRRRRRGREGRKEEEGKSRELSSCSHPSLMRMRVQSDGARERGEEDNKGFEGKRKVGGVEEGGEVPVARRYHERASRW